MVGTAIAEDEDIDERVKTKFIARLIREFRKTKELEKQKYLRENMEKEIENNIYNRFPQLGANGGGN